MKIPKFNEDDPCGWKVIRKYYTAEEIKTAKGLACGCSGCVLNLVLIPEFGDRIPDAEKPFMVC